MRPICILIALTVSAGAQALPTGDLLRDLDAAKGLKLEEGRFYILAGQQAAGTGTVRITLCVDDPTPPAATAEYPVNPNGNPSRMAIGQERDAIQHPGKESFDGEIARFLIWERPLRDSELQAAFTALKKHSNF